MKTKLLAIGIGALLLCGCAGDVANRYYGDIHYPPRSVEAVEVLKASPGRPYVVIADFQARRQTVEGLRQEAAKIGADAIIVATLGGRYYLGDEWAGQDSQAHTYSRIVGTAIKYTQ